MKILIFLITALLSFKSIANQKAWELWSLDQKAELFYDLEYAHEDSIPNGFKIIDLDPGDTFDLNKIKNPTHQIFVKTVIKNFDNSVSREEIEQSDYDTNGDERFLEFLLLVDKDNIIRGGILWVHQDGLDEDGNEADISWQASFRFNELGETLLDDSGTPFDDLYFSWSGH